MVIDACYCNWEIRGVQSLPAHNHVYTNALEGTGRYWDKGPFAGQEIMAMVADPDVICLWVDWKAVAR